MKILVLNNGSSSLKCCLYHFDDLPLHPLVPLWEAHLQWKNNLDSSTLKIKNHRGDTYSEKIKMTSTSAALKQLINALYQGKTAVLNSLDEVDVIGHRIVHGGKFFKESTLIDAQVKEKIRLLDELAPLHNLADLEGIEVMETFLKISRKSQFSIPPIITHCQKKQRSIPDPITGMKKGFNATGSMALAFNIVPGKQLSF